MKSVKIKTTYWDIAADLHFPPVFDENKEYPAIISAHPIGSCKEQTSGNVYGQALANSSNFRLACTSDGSKRNASFIAVRPRSGDASRPWDPGKSGNNCSVRPETRMLLRLGQVAQKDLHFPKHVGLVG
jgi:hypothetical protein